MATPAQLAANQRNAQKSTGPRSAEGKSASRFNALKHGVDSHSAVIPGEDPDAYRSLADAYDAQYTPSGPAQRFLLDVMIRADWQKQRLQKLESALLNKILAEAPESGSPDAGLLAAFLSDSPNSKLLARIQRQLAAHERAWFRAHKELTRLQNEANEANEGLEDFEPEPEAPRLEEPAAPIQLKMPERTQSPAPKPAASWPGADPVTGRAS